MDTENKTQNPTTPAVEAAKPVETTDKKPSFFVDETERFRVSLSILYDPKDGSIINIIRSENVNREQKLDFLRIDDEWFEFTVPNYSQISRYRQQSAFYSRQAGKMICDPVQFRQFLLINHLKDWSLKDKDGKKIELKTDTLGNLTEECVVNTVFKISAMLLDHVMEIFESDKQLS